MYISKYSINRLLTLFCWLIWSYALVINKERSFTSHEIVLEPVEHTSDLQFIREARPIFNYTKERLPLLAVPIRYGPFFLDRFVRSIDFNVGILLIIQDGLEDERLPPLIAALRLDVNITRYVHQIQHVIMGNSSGCTQNWNTVVRLYPGEPFWVTSAFDILLYPSSLQRFYHHLLQDLALPPASHNDSHPVSMIGVAGVRVFHGGNTYDNGFTHMFWAQTRQSYLTAGLYDENMFPAYHEDHEYIWRHFLSGMLIKYHGDVLIGHGHLHGYKGGTQQEDRNATFKLERARSPNLLYLLTKWGYNAQDWKDQLHYVNYQGHYNPEGLKKFKEDWLSNGYLQGMYLQPFNKSEHPINAWTYSEALRACIKDIHSKPHDACAKLVSVQMSNVSIAGRTVA